MSTTIETPVNQLHSSILMSSLKTQILGSFKGTKTKIWREKTNIRLQNHQLAIQNLKPIAKSLNFRNKLYPLANATVAEAFINLKELDSATYYMKRAALAAPKRKLKVRYLFITGQLFEKL